jgi:hypothetical protein
MLVMRGGGVFGGDGTHTVKNDRNLLCIDPGVTDGSARRRDDLEYGL